VVISTAANAGARFSDFGCSTLVLKQSGRNLKRQIVAKQIWSVR
jgi:hypothetical protein